MSGKTVTRADLYQAIYQKVGLSRTQSAALVELVLKEITDCLERGETVKLSSFGLFVVRKKGQRMGRNPKTGEEAPISPRRVVVFKPSVLSSGSMRLVPHRRNVEQGRNWRRYISMRAGKIAHLCLKRMVEYSRLFKEAWLARFPLPPATLELLALVVGCVKRDQPCWPLLR